MPILEICAQYIETAYGRDISILKCKHYILLNDLKPWYAMRKEHPIDEFLKYGHP